MESFVTAPFLKDHPSLNDCKVLLETEKLKYILSIKIRVLRMIKNCSLIE